MTWLIWYLSSCIICNSKSLRIKKKNKSELWNHLSYRGPSYLFEFGSQTYFQKWLQNSEVVAFDLKGKNSLKSIQTFQILMGGMNFRGRLQNNPNVLSSEGGMTCIAKVVAKMLFSGYSRVFLLCQIWIVKYYISYFVK